MSLLRIEVGAIAVHRDRLVMICSVGAPVRIRDLVTGEICEASVADLSARKTPELTRKSATAHRNLLNASAEQMERARFRHRCVTAVLAADKPLSSAIEWVCTTQAVGSRTLWRWLDRYRAWPTLEALLFTSWGVQREQRRLPEQSESIINSAIDEIYLTQPKGTYTAVCAEVWRRCHMNHIAGPSRNAIVRRIKEMDPWLVARHQLGRDEANRRFGAKPGALREKTPLAIVQIDHTLVDVHLVDDIHRKSIGRPWITVAIDVATRCVLGFHLSLEAPSVASVAACLSRSCLPKDGWIAELGIEADWPVWGVPNRIQADNAREFKTEALTRGCTEWNIEMSWRPIGRPHYGGHIERLIGTLMGRVHMLPGTSQSNPQKRGAYKSELAAQLTMSELERWLVIEISERYQLSIHRSLRKAPLHAWQDWFTSHGIQPAIPGDIDRFKISFMPMIKRKLGKQGLTFSGIQYWDNILPSLAQSGQSLLLRFDPRDISRLYALDKTGMYHPIPYADLTQPPITLAEAKAAIKTLDRRERGRGFGYRIMQAVMQQREILAQAEKATKAERRTQQRTTEAKRNSGKSGQIPDQFGEIDFNTDPPEYPVEYWEQN